MSDPQSAVVLRTRIIQPERAVAGTLSYPQRAVRPERQTAGRRQFAGALSRAAEAEQETAFGIEDSYLVRLEVGDDQPAARVLHDRLDPGEEEGIIAIEFAELEIDRALEGGDCIWRLLIGLPGAGGADVDERQQQRQPGRCLGGNAQVFHWELLV